MGLWIRAVCTKSVGKLGALELREATEDSDFEMWAEMKGLDESAGTEAEEQLRFEVAKNDVVLLRYLPTEERAISIERWTGAKAREELDELAEEIEDIDTPGADRVREVLAKAIESVAFECKQSDYDGMGWAIAWQTAMWIAARGEGLVQTDVDQWWDPDDYEVIVDYSDS